MYFSEIYLIEKIRLNSWIFLERIYSVITTLFRKKTELSFNKFSDIIYQIILKENFILYWNRIFFSLRRTVHNLTEAGNYSFL